MQRLATAVFVMLLACSSLFAQAKWGGIARHIAMGGSSAAQQGVVINPFIWDDPTYLFINPAFQVHYKNYLWTNIGGGTIAGLSTATNGYGFQNAGVNFSLDKEWSLGAVLSYDPSFINTSKSLIAGAGAIGAFFPGVSSIAQRLPQSIPNVANVWEIVGSYDGGSVDFGFGFMYGSSNGDSSRTSGTTSSNSEASARVFGFRAGALLDLGGGNAVDVSAAFRIDKATDKISMNPAPTIPIDGEYSVSGSELQVQGRLKFKLSTRVNLVPYIGFGSLAGEPKEDSKPASITAGTPRSMKLSLTAIALGIGSEYKTPDFFLAGGVSFFSAKAKVEFNQAAVGATPASSVTGTISNTALPVLNLGGEWWFLDWLAGRAGYYRAMGSVKFKQESSSGNASTSFESNLTTPSSFYLFGNLAGFDGIVTLGIGLRFGNFSLDATVSEEALRRGFGLIGSNDNINSFGFMNASYNFE